MKGTVLIVEDSIRAASLQGFALRSWDFENETAQDGAQALEKLCRDPGKLDLLVSDLAVPRMDDLTLVRKLRQNDAFRALPILLLTTEDEKESTEGSLRAGPNLYLTKPISTETVIGHIKMLLGEPPESI